MNHQAISREARKREIKDIFAALLADDSYLIGSLASSNEKEQLKESLVVYREALLNEEVLNDLQPLLVDNDHALRTARALLVLNDPTQGQEVFLTNLNEFCKEASYSKYDPFVRAAILMIIWLIATSIVALGLTAVTIILGGAALPVMLSLMLGGFVTGMLLGVIGAIGAITYDTNKISQDTRSQGKEIGDFLKGSSEKSSNLGNGFFSKANLPNLPDLLPGRPSLPSGSQVTPQPQEPNFETNIGFA